MSLFRKKEDRNKKVVLVPPKNAQLQKANLISSPILQFEGINKIIENPFSEKGRKEIMEILIKKYKIKMEKTLKLIYSAICDIYHNPIKVARERIGSYFVTEYSGDGRIIYKIETDKKDKRLKIIIVNIGGHKEVYGKG